MNSVLSIRFFTALSFYIYLPFFALYLKHVKFLNEADTALLTMILVFSSKVFSLAAPYFIKKLGNSITIFSTYSICLFSIISIMFFKNLFLMAFISIILGAGFAIGSIAIKNSIALGDSSKRLKLFVYLNIIVNLAAATGTIIGNYFSNGFLNFLPYASIITLILSLVILIPYSSKGTVKTLEVEEKPIAGQHKSRSLILWIGFIVSSMIPLFLYGMFFDTVAYQVDKYQSKINVGVLFTINGLIIIFLQAFIYSIMKKFNKFKLSNISFIIQILLSISMLLYNVKSFWCIIIFVILFSLYEMFWSPINDYLSVEFAPFKHKSMSIAIANFGWGIAESIGAYVGIRVDYQYYFIPVAIVIVISIVGNILIFNNKFVLEKI